VALWQTFALMVGAALLATLAVARRAEEVNAATAS